MDRAYDLESWGLLWERESRDKYKMTGSGGGTQLRMLGSYDEGIGITEVMIHAMRSTNVRVIENRKSSSQIDCTTPLGPNCLIHSEIRTEGSAKL